MELCCDQGWQYGRYQVMSAPSHVGPSASPPVMPAPSSSTGSLGGAQICPGGLSPPSPPPPWLRAWYLAEGPTWEGADMTGIGTVRFEITVRYEIFWAKSTVRNYGTMYFPRYGTVRKYDIFFVPFSTYHFRTFFVSTRNLIIEHSHRPLRFKLYVSDPG